MAEAASLEWLDQTYIRNLLRKGLRQDNLDILELKIEPATAAGDNYGSRMLRIHTTVKKNENDNPEKLSFIAKMLPDGLSMEQFKKYSLFPSEAEMLINALPAIDTLLKKAYPKHETLQAECYGFDQENRESIFLQDLRQLNFRLADRFGGGLDQQHTDLVLKSLAKFHAASVVYMKNQPEARKKFNQNAMNLENAETSKPMFETALDGYLELVNSRLEGPEKDKFAAKFNWLKENFLVKVMTNYERDDNALNVLIHGDFWTNNMMFKYEGSKPSAIKFVDFQLPMFNSPLIDLIYFTFTSQPDELKFGDKDAFLRTYHETFTETLERLNFILERPFTFEDLKNQFHRKLMHGLYALLIVYPITVCPPAKVAKTDDFLSGDNSRVNHIYNNEIMEAALKKAIPYFEKYNII